MELTIVLKPIVKNNIVTCILILGLGVYALWSQTPKLVVMDMKRAIEQPALMLSHSKMPENEQVVLMQRYSRLLPEVIKGYGATHHVTVVAAPIMTTYGDTDITNKMIELTLTRLKSERLNNHG